MRAPGGRRPGTRLRRSAKVRWSRAGSGKSGGVRVCYYKRTFAGQMLMLVIYAKSARDSIPGHVLKALREEMEDAQD